MYGFSLFSYNPDLLSLYDLNVMGLVEGLCEQQGNIKWDQQQGNPPDNANINITIVNTGFWIN